VGAAVSLGVVPDSCHSCCAGQDLPPVVRSLEVVLESAVQAHARH